MKGPLSFDGRNWGLAGNGVAFFEAFDGTNRGLYRADYLGTIDKVPYDEWLRTLQINVGGTAAVVRAVLPTMADSLGRRNTDGHRGF